MAYIYICKQQQVTALTSAISKNPHRIVNYKFLKDPAITKYKIMEI